MPTTGVTVIVAVRGGILLTVTLTVPLATILPDHVRLAGFVLLVTVLLFPSVNFQFETVTPEGVTVHVAVPPRTTEDEQVSRATLPLTGVTGIGS
jgi:hypothetical protein